MFASAHIYTLIYASTHLIFETHVKVKCRYQYSSYLNTKVCTPLIFNKVSNWFLCCELRILPGAFRSYPSTSSVGLFVCPEGPVLRTFGKKCSSSFNFLKRWCYSLSRCCDFRYKEIIFGVWPNSSSLQNIPFPLSLRRTLNIGYSLQSLLYLLYLKMLLSGCCQVSKTFPGVFPPKQFPGRTFSFFRIQFGEANGEPSTGFSRFCSGEPLEGHTDRRATIPIASGLGRAWTRELHFHFYLHLYLHLWLSLHLGFSIDSYLPNTKLQALSGLMRSKT